MNNLIFSSFNGLWFKYHFSLIGKKISIKKTLMELFLLSLNVALRERLFGS